MKKIPIECIVETNTHGTHTPKKIRFYINDESIVLQIDKILVRDKQTIFPTMNQPRSTEFIYKCEIIQDGYRKPITLNFNTHSCEWNMNM